MIKRIIFFLALLMLQNGFAQSGYLGSLNNVSITIKTVPSLKNKFKLNNDMTEAKKSLRLAYLSYELSYSRILTKYIEISGSYGFSSMTAVTQGMSYVKVDSIITTSGFPTTVSTSLNVLEDPQLNLHQFSFDFRYFRLGSLAPTGKYIGFGLEFGLTSLNSNNAIVVGKKGPSTSSNFLTSKYGVLESQLVNLDRGYTANYMQLNGNIGRNYPITQDLMVGIGMTFPVFTTYGYDGLRYFGFNIDGSSGSFNESSNLRNMVLYTIEKYKRISIDLSLKYFF